MPLHRLGKENQKQFFNHLCLQIKSDIDSLTVDASMEDLAGMVIPIYNQFPVHPKIACHATVSLEPDSTYVSVCSFMSSTHIKRHEPKSYN